MNNQQSAYFENWVRQEQIGYWLISFALIAISVAALAFNVMMPPTPIIVEGTTSVVIEESPALTAFGLLLYAMPALWGLFILYWTSSREHVRALTTALLHQRVMRWRLFGITFVILGLLQFFSEGSILQRIVIAPSLLIFGLFATFRSFKIAGFRALGEMK